MGFRFNSGAPTINGPTMRGLFSFKLKRIVERLMLPTGTRVTPSDERIGPH